MELIQDFRVGVSVSEAWKVLTDVERIAPMMPGAQLQEVEGDEYRGVVKVKVGPISAQYKGVATFVERDEEAGRVVLKASGRDTRGQGNASALITATMTPDGDATHVKVVTDLTITGKVAQFGRGVLAEVSSKLMGQFVDALEADLESSAQGGSGGTDTLGAGETSESAGSAATSESVTESESALAPEATPADISANGSSEAEISGPRRIDSPEAQPVDLIAVAGGSALKRLLPVAIVALVLLIVLARRRVLGNGGGSRS
jgi:carbon monoxide dehydrogenase subunit G